MRFLIMDSRAFNDVEFATIIDTAEDEEQAISRARKYGSLKKFEVAIVEEDEVRWDLYAD